MKKTRIAFIGTGVISHRHMRVWNQIPEAEIVAACDIDKKTLTAWGEQYGVAEKDLYTDYRELLKRDDIDAVDVCVHNNLHLPLSVAVMKAGKHCYCEKPMAGSYADAKALYDAQALYGKKLAVQLSSVMNKQARIAKEFVEKGKLGKVYHARSIGHRRLGRPGLDMKGLSPDFYSSFYAGHGPLFDMGVYHISMMLYVLGMPKLEAVFGAAYNGVEIDERLLEGRTYGVEDLGVGIARFEGGLTLDVLEDWALNVDTVGDPFIAGSKGGLKFRGIDAGGGLLAYNPNGPFKRRPYELLFYGYDADGNMLDMDLMPEDNQKREQLADPSIAKFNDNHLHWLAYLNGELTDETRIDTPKIALDMLLVSEGIFLSQKLGRSVSREEIEAMSESTAVRRQETPWGVFEYDF